MTEPMVPVKKRNRNLFSDIATGVTTAIALFFAIQYGIQQYNNFLESGPASNWVEVTRLEIPNFTVGTDPSIAYEREIKQSVQSNWTAELRYFYNEDGEYSTACNNSGFSNLEPSRVPPADGWHLSDFIGKGCAIEPGNYRLTVVWNLRPVGYSQSIVYNFSSNDFVVTP